MSENTAETSNDQERTTHDRQTGHTSDPARRAPSVRTPTTWQQTASKLLSGLIRIDKECGLRKPRQRDTWRSVMPLLCELMREAFHGLSVADRLRFAEICAVFAKYKPPRGHHNDVARCVSCGALADHAALRAAFNKRCGGNVSGSARNV
jgi:hypothetical protein